MVESHRLLSDGDNGAVDRFLDIWHDVVDEYYSILTAGNEKSVKRSFTRFVDKLALYL